MACTCLEDRLELYKTRYNAVNMDIGIHRSFMTPHMYFVHAVYQIRRGKHKKLSNENRSLQIIFCPFCGKKYKED